MREQSVKVVVRVRPLNEKEKIRNSQPIVKVNQEQSQITLYKQAQKSSQVKIFCFDSVFSESQSQDAVYESAGRQLIEKVIEGYNGTIFAYGQTGSGKTYTMMGDLRSQNQEGIIPRSFDQLLTTIKQKSDKNFLVQCSYLEIYNQDIHDLLSSNLKNKLDIRESLQKGVFVKDLQRRTVRTVSELNKYLIYGNSNRAVAQTLMNVESSRSHAILTLYVESSEQCGQIERFTACKLNLVDLAGSERQSKTGSYGDRLKEASKINLSLSALGNVISALIEGKDHHIPYRDSKLTRLLQDSLGGNTKTIMITNISSCSLSYDQTLSTLRYASRAKYIQNTPVINEDPKDTLLRQYEEQIKRLQKQLKILQTQTGEENEEQMLPSINNIFEKQELMDKIRKLEGELIHPSVLKQQLIEQRNKRKQQLSFMGRNYDHLQKEVQEMKGLLKQLRKKYKTAAKQIVGLQKEHEQQRNKMIEKYKHIQRQDIINRTVINTLFTPKQFIQLTGMGQWQSEEVFKLPPFYFKDKYTLAFPYEKNGSNHQSIQGSEKRKQLTENKRNLFNNPLKKKY